jgi:hypothetical protein
MQDNNTDDLITKWQSHLVRISTGVERVARAMSAYATGLTDERMQLLKESIRRSNGAHKKILQLINEIESTLKQFEAERQIQERLTGVKLNSTLSIKIKGSSAPGTPLIVDLRDASKDE